MTELPFISSPISSAWPAWILVALILMGLIIYRHNHKDLFRLTMMTTYRWAVVSLTLYLLSFHRGEFAFVTWLKIMGLIMALDAMKYLILWLVVYTFEIDMRSTNLLSQYHTNWFYISTTCIPLCILSLHFPSNPIILGIGMALLAIQLLWAMGRSIHALMGKITDIFNILLYIFTAEILPLGLIIYAVQLWTR